MFPTRVRGEGGGACFIMACGVVIVYVIVVVVVVVFFFFFFTICYVIESGRSRGEVCRVRAVVIVVVKRGWMAFIVALLIIVLEGRALDCYCVGRTRHSYDISRVSM